MIRIPTFRSNANWLVSFALLLGQFEVGCAGKNTPTSDSSAGSGGAAGGGAVGVVGGSSGVGGDATGASGEGGGPECIVDADCDDQNLCTGEERCIRGTCTAGELPCTNPDPEHCDVACEAVDGKAQCTARGKDGDKDQHRASSCKQDSLADDCDDSNKNVFTGAPELCDRLDNDCDGKSDLEDGLGPIHDAQFLGTNRRALNVAWSQKHGVYGQVWRDATAAADKDVLFETVNQKGEVQTKPYALNMGYGQTVVSRLYPIALSATKDSFGVAWVSPHGGWNVHIRRLGAQAEEILGNFMLAGDFEVSNPAAATLDDGRLAAVWYEFNKKDIVWGSSLPLAQTTPTKQDLNGDTKAGTYPAIAGVGDKFLVAYNIYDDLKKDWFAHAFLRTGLLADPKSIPITGQLPVVAGDSGGFGIATVRSGNQPLFTSFDKDGATLCGPVDLARPGFVAQHMAATATGYIVVSTNLGARGIEISRDCKPGPVFEISTLGTPKDARIAAGDEGFAVVWRNDVATTYYRRFFGPNICD